MVALFTLETGVGVRGANALASVAFVTQYLEDQGREAEASWSTITEAAKQAAIVAATLYVETRWGLRFKGVKTFTFQEVKAVGKFTHLLQATGSETVTVAGVTYTVPTDADLSAAATALAALIATNQNVQTAVAEGAVVTITAAAYGSVGNDLDLASSAAPTVQVTQAFSGGADGGVQEVSFPRQSIFDRHGHAVLGIPPKVKQAVAEYAVRAVAAALYQDPVVDETGRTVVEKFDKLGPLETRVRYEDGAALSRLIKPYPAADRLLSEFVVSGGGAVR